MEGAVLPIGELRFDVKHGMCPCGVNEAGAPPGKGGFDWFVYCSFPGEPRGSLPLTSERAWINRVLGALPRTKGLGSTGSRAGGAARLSAWPRLSAWQPRTAHPPAGGLQPHLRGALPLLVGKGYRL